MAVIEEIIRKLEANRGTSCSGRDQEFAVAMQTESANATRRLRRGYCAGSTFRSQSSC